VKKQLGCSWVEVNNEVHKFVVDDQDHPQMIEICAELKRLSELMYDAGVCDIHKIVLHDVEEEEKVLHLCHHSEKLAIALGLINTTPGTPLQINKYLQVCDDCHNSTKFISKIIGRAIMVRDTNCFHHLEITLRMVSVLAWTIGDASSLSCQSVYQVHCVCSMCSGIIATIVEHCYEM